MAPIAKELEATVTAPANAGIGAQAVAKPQPAAAEIPVTVNGARSVEGSDKREPFSENTQTVLVFANGAVIRLASAVAAGQLLFLTNEKTKKEVVCQVVKSKNYSSMSGYVELEFTEAAPGFWGMRFPAGVPATADSSAAKPIASVAAPTMKSLQEKLAEAKAQLPAVPKAAEVKAIPASEPTQRFSESPLTDSRGLNAASLLPAQEQGSAAKIPTLSEFLTPNVTSISLKAPEKHKEENGARQAAQKESPSSPAIPPAAKGNPAPGASTFDFGSDAVKIPAWLEPLARNAAISCAPQETIAAEPALFETKTSPALIAGSTTEELPELDKRSMGAAAEGSEQQEAEFTHSNEGSTPNFGSSLILDEKSTEVENGSKGSSKGLKFALLAAGLLLAAAGAWYWYSNQPKNVAANTDAAAQTNFGAPVAASPPSSSLAGAKPKPPNAALGRDANRNPADAQPARTEITGSATSASNSRKATESAVSSVQPSLPASMPGGDPAAQPAVEPEKKPSLGKVHLGAPVVNRRASVIDNSAADSEFAINGNGVTGSEAGSLNMLASKSNQPSAPVPIGGDVKQARLLFSVAPQYPQLARNQRLSGDVKVDALVDVNGRVSAMKVISGPALLHQAAMDALRQWKYQPATLNGQPMAMHLTVTVQFKLQ